jgi:hypothetical protein
VTKRVRRLIRLIRHLPQPTEKDLRLAWLREARKPLDAGRQLVGLDAGVNHKGHAARQERFGDIECPLAVKAEIEHRGVRRPFRGRCEPHAFELPLDGHHRPAISDCGVGEIYSDHRLIFEDPEARASFFRTAHQGTSEKVASSGP